MPNKKQTIDVQGIEIVVFSKEKQNYISLTDIAKHKNSEAPADIVKNWMRNRSTIEILNWSNSTGLKKKPGVITLCYRLKNGSLQRML
jgi:hypothetical protein